MGVMSLSLLIIGVLCLGGLAAVVVAVVVAWMQSRNEPPKD